MTASPHDPRNEKDQAEADGELADERGFFSETMPRKADAAGRRASPPVPEAHYHGHRERLRSKFRDLGDMQAHVLETQGDGALLSLDLSESQYELLLKRLYVEGVVPSIASTRMSAIIGSVLKRASRL